MSTSILRLTRFAFSALAAGALALGLHAAAGCGSSSSSSGPGETAGIDGGADGGSKHLTELSDAEKKLLCDWTAAEGGGYGKLVQCGDGGTVYRNKKDLAECLAEFPGGCNATVADFEACRKTEVKDLCAGALLTADECKPLLSCTPGAKGDGGTDGG